MAEDKISQKQYDTDFGDTKKKKRALDHALDIRKFEIELYWKRATYFWTFIGVTFAGYGAIQASSSLPPESKADLSVYLSCLGLVLSFGWFCANKGSKQWQENWENHVDLLENDIVGPLYKTTLGRPAPDGLGKYVESLITGPAHFSVSKINQIISLFVTTVWGVLLSKALKGTSISWDYKAMICATVVTIFLFFVCGRTSSKLHHQIVRHKRDSEIISPKLVSESAKNTQN